MAYLTETHRLQLNRNEHGLLDRMLWMTRLLYNAGLEDRRNAWEHGKRLASKHGLASPYQLDADVWTPPSKAGHFACLTRIRADDSAGWGALPTNIGREVLERVDRAFRGVFVNGRGLPRFKSASRWRSFGFDEMNGVSIAGDRIVFEAFGVRRHIAFKRHRDWPEGAEAKSVRFMKKCNRWEIHVQVAFDVVGELVQIKPVMPSQSALRSLDDDQIKAARKDRRQIANGINKVLSDEYDEARKAAFRSAFEDGEVRGWDANVENHATNDLGQRIENPRLTDKHRAARSTVERQISRQKVGSKRWKRTVKRRRRLGECERNGNRTFAHQVSRTMVRQSPFLVFEALKLTNMTASAKGTIGEPGRNVAQKSGLNREMLGNCHGMRMTYATYKAERAGGLVVRVPPHGTSQDCSWCVTRGVIDDDRIFHCQACGLTMDRDRNAAINIIDRSWGVVAPGVVRLPGRTARKDQREALAA